MYYLSSEMEEGKYEIYSDEELLTSLFNDDVLAFGELYNRYRHNVYRYLITLVKNPTLAEDLLQDVFVKIWDARQKIDVKKNFKGYLFRICHNKAVDANKELATNQILRAQMLYAYLQMSAMEVMAPEEEQYNYDLLQRAIAALSPQRRKIYELCKLQGKSYETVARDLQVSPNTVKNTMVQTLAFLKDFVRQKGKTALFVLSLQEFL